MSQSLSQRKGIARALQLFGAKRRRAPYTAKISALSISQKNQREARNKAIRAKMLLTAGNLLQRTATAWRIAAPWIAALAIVAAISLAQIADDAKKAVAEAEAQRDALLAANQPGASIHMQASSLALLATTARHFATAIDTEAGRTHPQRGAGAQ